MKYAICIDGEYPTRESVKQVLLGKSENIYTFAGRYGAFDGDNLEAIIAVAGILSIRLEKIDPDTKHTVQIIESE